MTSTGEVWPVSRWPQTLQQAVGLAIIAGIIWAQFPSARGAEDPQGYVKVSAYDPRPDGMAISLRKVAGDSADLNIDGGITVKHGKAYSATPGYADTLQVYALAGSAGTVVGSNNYVGSGAVPYAPPNNASPNGFIRFELGPIWPESEKMRLNNGGDLILGWDSRTKVRGFTQAGYVVRGSGFTPSMVGDYVVWTGRRGVADRITRYVNGSTVVVETPRRFSHRQGAQVRAARMLLKPETGTLTIDGASLYVEGGSLMFRGGDGTVTTIAPK